MDNKLKKGDKVAIVSPSATIQDNPDGKNLCEKGAKMLLGMGLEVVYALHWDDKDGYKAGKLADRISDLEQSFADPDVKAVMCTQGGDNSNELLDKLNWDLLGKSKALLFGSSDITVLLNALYAKTKRVSYHGTDLMWGLGMNASEYTEKNLHDLLFNGVVNYAHKNDYPEWKTIRAGEGSGVCLGGCIPSFTLLLGTDYSPLKDIDEDYILILESIGESFSRIEANIAQLTQQPGFKEHCKGVITGYFFLCKEEIEANTRSVSEIVLEYTEGLNFPIIEIQELGHAIENIFFPIGGKIRIKASESDITIENDLTKS
jgi:muramoyltetrapeptide carboxypeptidase